MRTVNPVLRRRVWLLSAAGMGVAPAWAQTAAPHGSFGFVQPAQPAPTLALRNVSGKTDTLRQLLTGHTTAVQLMFTGCSATCPIQGALFAAVQQGLSNQDKRLRLLSLSIDPLSDDPPALRSWLSKHGAQGSRWVAAAPRLQDVDRLLDFLRGRAAGADRHTAQAFVFDRQARLSYRTQDMPDPQALVALMRRMDSAN